MRGKLAKEFRRLCTHEDGTFEKSAYKELKRFHVRSVAFKYYPKLPRKTRWDRSPLKFSRAPDSDSGIHQRKSHPLRKLGKIFIDLNEYGQAQALYIAKQADKLSVPELHKKVNALINDKRKYAQQPDTETNES